MRAYHFILLVLSAAVVSHGQTQYAEFTVESNKIDDIQAFEVHDSIFFTFTERGIRKAFWIDSAGKASQFYLNNVRDMRVCGIQKHSDTTYIYYLLTEDNVLQLYALKQASAGGNVYSGARTLTLYGDLLAINADDTELNVICYLKKSNRVEIISIDRGIKKSFADLQMPEDFSRYANSSGLLTEHKLTTIPQGAAQTKIYKEGRSIVFTIDEDRFAVKKSATTIIRVDLATGKHTLYVVPGPDHYQFSSFYHNSKLFRLTSSREKYEWSVIDISTGEKVYFKTLNQEKSLRDQKVLIRTAETQEIWYGTMSHMINQAGNPTLIVETIPGTTDLRLVTGTFENSKGVAVAAGMTPLAILGGLLVYNIINQLEAPPGVQQYFYLKGDLENGFDVEPFENSLTPSVRQLIDNHEISRTSGVSKGEQKWSWFLLYKGYLALKDGALGIYQEKRNNESKIVLLKYKT